MKVTALELPGMLSLVPDVYRDARGFFLEAWSERHYRSAGIDLPFVQDNHSRSRAGTVRGLHYQTFGPGADGLPGQGKLVRVLRGRVWDVALDLRRGSPTFGRWTAQMLDDVTHEQVYIPPGFAHGFAAMSDEADVLYKVTTFFDAALERGIAWDDAELAIPWPVDRSGDDGIGAPLISERDRANPSWADFRREVA